MKHIFEVGDYFHTSGACIEQISKIEGENIYFGDIASPLHEYSINPIKIRGGADKFVLECTSPKLHPMALYIERGMSSPVHGRLSYLESSVYQEDNEMKISDIIEENKFGYIHELQSYLRNNYPDYCLKLG